ncbi:MAG: TIGR02647 family protein [Pseudomonadales bacterium]|nr:TIGR02647 family protein [Pseudomonadales bacterium]
MPFSQQIIDELNVLCLYNLASSQEGIKIHSTAEPQTISAATRLHDKGLISQVDGGYLTELGRSAAEHAQALLIIIKPVS